ncbi:GTP-binding protein [Candidatus Gottesmanbacteria bacterium]|nr:GTP-binding protein [Candidatus Gottesmanbacteria bacterium]
MVKNKKEPKNTNSFRPPIVAILGHVDHGKTTLLDVIRKSNLAAKEIGGITQNIGAYSVEVDTKDGKKNITFIDTPGHETFNKIRSRGATIADIAVLVVSAADNVQPQTIEAINIIKETKIPFLVAITKIDLERNLDSIKKRLAKEGVLVEGFGGDIVSIGVSAKTQEGIKELLEMIILLAQMQDLVSEKDANLEAVVIDSRIDKRRGVEASLIVKKGTLKVGETVFSKEQTAKIRAIINDNGQNVDTIGPSGGCIVLGFTKPLLVGEVIGSRKIDEEVVKVSERNIEESEEAKPETLLRLVLKADSYNSLEAITLSLPGDGLKIITQGYGDISESDVFLAKTTKAIIVGFKVKVSDKAQEVARFEKVKIKTYDVIYKLLEEITEVLKSLGKTDINEVFGRAKIIAEFPFDNKRIAGVKVIEGRIARGDSISLERDEEKIGTARIKTIKRLKEEVNKSEVGEESGILIDPNLDFKVGDMILSVQS